ncbi:thioesterase domain-containing protein [Neobacillus drentensis]|uniref:thioesterase domain-containing protein n=1 Tax=Neobacillus drentensis TaxID=220684 RepID=UPI001F48E087|nr:alpha/beta fold hydrolase [Neobacillus drentensis]ULT56194.1 thioesterase domain-containing protein [Neobacillus drentensis]
MVNVSVSSVSKRGAQDSLPRNTTEKKLLEIWESTLDVSSIGIRDNFFELGGNSYLAIQMFSEIEKIFNKRLPTSIILQEGTIENLARILSSNNQTALMSSSLVAIQSFGSKKPLFCIHGGGGEVLIYRHLAMELGSDQQLYGLRYPNSGKTDKITVESLAEKYVKEIRKIQSNGPYSLLGFCIGGAIAYEMAQKLIEAGEEVSVLTILNFANPHKIPLIIPKEMPLNKKIINKMTKIYAMSMKQRVLFVKETFQKALGKLFARNTIENSAINGMAQTRMTLRTAIRGYKPNPYPGKILLISGVRYNDYEENLGWETVDNGSIEVYKIGVDHDRFLKKPNIQFVGKYLQRHLEMEK